MSECNISYSEANSMDIDDLLEANAALDIKMEQLKREGGRKK